MTLIIGAEGQDFVIAGADSLGTYESGGGSVCVNSIKYFKVSNHVVILLAGWGDIGHQLISNFIEEIRRLNIDGATNILNKFVDFGRENFDHLRSMPIDSLPACAFIIVGLDKEGRKYKIPKSYVVRSHYNFMVGSDNLGYKIDGRPVIARYIFKKYYDSIDKSSTEDLATLVMGTLYDVGEVANDGAVGGEIQDIKLAKITSSGITLFTVQEKEEFKSKWVSHTTF